MAFKEFTVTTGHPVKVYKRKNSRSLRLSVTHSGDIRVSIPTWVPYTAGVTFAESRMAWIEKQLPASQNTLDDSQTIGKYHRIYFRPASVTKPSSRIGLTEIIIKYPLGSSLQDPVVQKVATVACVRALRSQAEQLLPQRLATLAAKHGYDYRSVGVKQLKARWGSCDQHKNIVLNLFLMQLPWDLIDYVLLHELAHTRVLQHGAPFWEEMARHLPAAKQLRKAMRAHQPTLLTNNQAPVA